MRTEPGILQFLKEDNIVKYDAFKMTPEKIKTQKYIIKGMIKLLNDLNTSYKEKQEIERIRILNNKGKGYYINSIFYAPANPINNNDKNT
jgi:hypothetical protein